MKALRYLLMIVAVMGAMSVSAQTPRYGNTYKPYEQAKYGTTMTVQMPEATIGSTSSDYMTTGSTLPLAAVTGTITTYDNPGGPAKMRRDVGGGGSTADDEDPDGPGEPFPLGDAALPLALLALAYVCVRAFLRRKRA